jgi:II/X family phage/plasmid replication protein
MIDWVTAIVPCWHIERVCGDRLISLTPDGEISWTFDKPCAVVGSHSNTIRVKSHGPNLLLIDGNPAKWLQGHNLFGTDDLNGLMLETLKRLCRILRLYPRLSDYRAWKNGNYELSRVDATAMWDLPTRGDVRAWIRAVEMQAKSRHGRPTSRGGTVYFGKNSRRWALKFYSKGDELEARGNGHALCEQIQLREMLISYANTKLRGELTLRQMHLKKFGLHKANSWTENTPMDLLQDRIQSLNMADQFSLTPECIEGLPPRLVLVYESWLQGRDMRQLLPLRTFYRYRKELLERGIDIGIRQPGQPGNVIPLIRVLRPEAIAPVPSWAVGTSLYFEPKRVGK